MHTNGIFKRGRAATSPESTFRGFQITTSSSRGCRASRSASLATGRGLPTAGGICSSRLRA